MADLSQDKVPTMELPRRFVKARERRVSALEMLRTLLQLHHH